MNSIERLTAVYFLNVLRRDEGRRHIARDCSLNNKHDYRCICGTFRRGMLRADHTQMSRRNVYVARKNASGTRATLIVTEIKNTVIARL
ncbi:hypothetical protein WN55_09662 [Dufourea novaeangliae]|uniref:Uncharacterized protein n=1 Tax=Dufourea novaeangliae TaxID=178035 RepID=A0A154NZ18_DUFNO|nr:hypothetical protein WN55_09662 [Dufourea novaeangliae]